MGFGASRKRFCGVKAEPKELMKTEAEITDSGASTRSRQFFMGSHCVSKRSSAHSTLAYLESYNKGGAPLARRAHRAGPGHHHPIVGRGGKEWTEKRLAGH